MLNSTRKRSLSPTAGSALERRRVYDVDELLLQNERMADEVKSLTEELTRAKDKSARQLSYMEDENDKLRKMATEVKNKYVLSFDICIVMVISCTNIYANIKMNFPAIKNVTHDLI
jgi:hypothetical protein